MNDAHFIELIEGLIAGEISDADHKQLQQTLKTDAAARAAFRERMDLEAGLRTLASEGTHQTQQAIPVGNSEALPNQPWKTRSFLLIAVAASVLLMLGIQLGKRFMNDPGDDIAQGPPPNAGSNSDDVQYVGVIRQQEDCQWKVSPVSQAGKLSLGTLSLTKGVAELDFESGTGITLEAPCEIVITSPDTARLIEGNVFVNVTELSNGFTLHTPESQIFDEGTQYAVSVSDDETEVHVFDGQVVWISTTTSDVTASDYEERIEAGEARSYLRSEPTRSRRIPFGKRQFVRQIEQRVRESAAGSLLAYDGFENIAGRLRRGRSGFGWADGWQSGIPGRGRMANIVDTPVEPVFGFDRQNRRQLALDNGCDMRRVFAEPLALTPGSTLYISVLLERVSTEQSDSGQSLQISLEPDLPGRGRRLHQILSYGVSTVGFPFINSGQSISEIASPISSNQTYLCVVKLSTTTEGTFPLLRIYQPGETVDVDEPSQWTVTGTRGSTRYPAASLRIISGRNARWHVDELRVGSTWQGVTTTTDSP